MPRTRDLAIFAVTTDDRHTLLLAHARGVKIKRGICELTYVIRGPAPSQQGLVSEYSSCSSAYGYPTWPDCQATVHTDRDSPTVNECGDLASDWSARKLGTWGQPHQVKRDVKRSDWAALLAGFEGTTR